jgi:hypothetical protein
MLISRNTRAGKPKVDAALPLLALETDAGTALPQV